MFPDDPFSTELGPGDSLGQYEILARIGVGGMATVYRASGPDGREVAIKVMEPGHDDEEDISRFEREYHAVADIDHPHIVGVLDAGRTGPRPWIALELVDGIDLEQAIQDWQTAPPKNRFQLVERILRQLLSALQHIHERGLIHRDLKPANILLTQDMNAKLSDFGVVKRDESSHITVAGRLVGTIAYMAPELISEDPVDARTDLYGMGAVLYTMLTLRKPIEADSLTGYLARHLTERPTPPHELDEKVPLHLEQICMRLLEKEPSKRFSSARAVLEQLDAPEAKRATRLHGRDEAMALWSQKLTLLRRGVGSVVVIAGPKGSGRTTLIDHFDEAARDAGRTVLHICDASSSDADVLFVDDLDAQPAAIRRHAERLVRDLERSPDMAKLLVFSTQQTRVEELLGHAPDDAHVTVVPLEPLSVRAVVAMLRERGVPTAAATALGNRLGLRPAAFPAAIIDLFDAMLATGWWEKRQGKLVSTKRLGEYRSADLPMTEAQTEQLARELAALPHLERDILEIVALLNIPADLSTLRRALDEHVAISDGVKHLIQRGLLMPVGEGPDAPLGLAHPSTRAYIRHHLDPERATRLHLTIATALRRLRRRAGIAAEVARHLALAGYPGEAVPQWIRAAQQADRAGRPKQVLSLVDKAEDALESLTDKTILGDKLPTLLVLRGTALLSLGQWTEAVPHLERAADLARDADDAMLEARALANLGRALYRLRNFDRAISRLQSALDRGQTTRLDLSSAARALADIHIQRGELDSAERDFRTQLAQAKAKRSPDAEARARRGIAHVHGLRTDYTAAATELNIADELLMPDGNPHVRAGVMRRSVELELAAGRYGTALVRAELLVDLTSTQGPPHLLPVALGLKAQTLLSLGRTSEAGADAERALAMAEHQQPAPWDGIMRASRVRHAVGDSAHPLIHTLAPPPHLVYDPQGQLQALRARFISGEDPMRGVPMAVAALQRSGALWSLARWQMVMDAAIALRDAGEIDACIHCISDNLGLLDPSRSDGAQLDAALVANTAGATETVQVIRTLSARIAEQLPARHAKSFQARPDIRLAHR